MIQLSKNYSLPEREEEIIPIKVVGVGGAGSNALDRIVLDGLEKADHVAINTDVQSLASSVAASKVQLGRTVTRGLGAGGDPEVGYNAAAESADEIRQALAGARMIFVCAGLGGGTGSGAAPFIAQLARDAGSLVVGFATMPFSFEGRRRTVQAQEAIERFNQSADAVICFENDRMGDMVAPRAGIHQAFAVGDNTISQSVRSIVNLIQRPGLIRIGFDDLLAALRTPNGRCLFGFGESESGNRAHDALTQALKNPLMDRGKMLANAAHVLVQIAGGPAMTLSEVEILMKELGRHISDETQIFFGTAVDNRMGNRLSVTLISSLSPDGVAVEPRKKTFVPEPVEPPPPMSPPIWEQREEPAPPIQMPNEPSEAPALVTEFAEFAELTPEPEPEAEAEVEIERAPPIEEVTPPPVPVAAKKKLIPPKEPKPPVEKKHAKQEVLQFEPVTRGRFEKSEPTIVEGQDLDVPTFLRKNVRVK
jgi:cell division protein FtsZ